MRVSTALSVLTAPSDENNNEQTQAEDDVQTPADEGGAIVNEQTQADEGVALVTGAI